MKDFRQNLVALEASPLGQFFNFQRIDQCQARFFKNYIPGELAESSCSIFRAQLQFNRPNHGFGSHLDE